MDPTRRVILVVAAHPDDEVLGCGGTIARLADHGAEIQVAFLADGVGARSADIAPSHGDLVRRREAATRACEILGARPPSFDDLPDNRLDIVPLLDVVKRVEALLEMHRPDTVLTHHRGDVNIDHRIVHDAVVTACRPQPRHSVRRLAFFEVASSTEWQPPGSAPAFLPNLFVDISYTLERKMAALGAYAEEMRDWPHPRSLVAVEYLARWRGASVGVDAAEAFMLGREIF